ncbi:crAss001_48 related protein [Lactobacillus crispatus]|uniref:crAss001_48 related protein n=1 Tax=Lactobacillus crispatus TaxID=47770 RepID=UPI00103BC9F7|nr:hypothetical protein [Lactobacillus crispatus]
MELIDELKNERKEYDHRLFKLKATLDKPNESITPRQYDLLRRQSIDMRSVINDLTARINDLEMN